MLAIAREEQYTAQPKRNEQLHRKIRFSQRFEGTYLKKLQEIARSGNKPRQNLE
jgi:hypothetical protein